ncbi:MAG: hypothetical protein B7Z15_05695 [Rhizobiales bacterium 32-66-8]|nr:MAG: hypothetical protein B7Z15_05695 [Rhizobiales bacterium 32-66-8]
MSHPGASGAAGDLVRLRRQIAAIEQQGAPCSAPPPAGLEAAGAPRLALLPFAIPALDEMLGGGLALGALHEAAASGPGAEGALAAFALGLAARAAHLRRRPILMVQQDLAQMEAGRLYGPGLEALGLGSGALLLVQVRKPQDVLFVMEEGLKCPGLAAVLGEVASSFPEALTATRRLSLAARGGSTLGLLLRQRPDGAASAAQTRWVISPAASQPRDPFGGLGPTTLTAVLARNRLGPVGQWTLTLDGQVFDLAPAAPAQLPQDTGHDPHQLAQPGRLPAPPLPFPVARTPRHRPDRAHDVA